MTKKIQARWGPSIIPTTSPLTERSKIDRLGQRVSGQRLMVDKDYGQKRVVQMLLAGEEWCGMVATKWTTEKECSKQTASRGSPSKY